MRMNRRELYDDIVEGVESIVKGRPLKPLKGEKTWKDYAITAAYIMDVKKNINQTKTYNFIVNQITGAPDDMKMDVAKGLVELAANYSKKDITDLLYTSSHCSVSRTNEVPLSEGQISTYHDLTKDSDHFYEYL